jgi:hypothetical protein
MRQVDYDRCGFWLSLAVLFVVGLSLLAHDMAISPASGQLRTSTCPGHSIPKPPHKQLAQIVSITRVDNGFIVKWKGSSRVDHGVRVHATAHEALRDAARLLGIEEPRFKDLNESNAQVD